MSTVKGGSDDIGYDVDTNTSESIHSLKENLATVVSEYLRCTAENMSSLKTFESDLANLVGANRTERPSQTSTDNTMMPSDSVFGGELRISVTKPDAGPQLIAVETSFSIGCGNDTMLLIYQWKREAWQLTVRWQSGDYKEVSGAFGDFFKFVVLPRKETGEWLVVVAHGMPWCTSRWSGYDLDVIQPSSSGESQRLLAHKHSSYVRFDVDPTMKLVPGGFEIRLQTGQLDLAYMTHMGIYRYHVIDNELQRVQPIAMNGRDFVDEWLQADWSDAINWSASAHLDNLQKVHADVARRYAPNSGDNTLFSYGPVRGCAGDAKHFQVEFDRDSGSPTFFQIEQGENSFSMLDASSSSNPRCKGADLMKKQ